MLDWHVVLVSVSEAWLGCGSESLLLKGWVTALCG
jgi:hypothetical protein